MIKLKYNNEYSTFEDHSELAKLIFDTLSINNSEVLTYKLINKTEAKRILLKLEPVIEHKISNLEQYSINQFKTINFGQNEIQLNLRDKNHKNAFFLIKSYNLIFSFVNDDGKLTIEEIKDSDFVFKAD